mmetsp:Transcript_173947/g.423103  ORF Transcript_173947/g.423103 Transcript_173947/m.423103 type:complete len:247 (-) Transcript_173947:1440-2180(-)
MFASFAVHWIAAHDQWQGHVQQQSAKEGATEGEPVQHAHPFQAGADDHQYKKHHPRPPLLSDLAWLLDIIIKIIKVGKVQVACQALLIARPAVEAAALVEGQHREKPNREHGLGSYQPRGRICRLHWSLGQQYLCIGPWQVCRHLHAIIHTGLCAAGGAICSGGGTVPEDLPDLGLRGPGLPLLARILHPCIWRLRVDATLMRVRTLARIGMVHPLRKEAAMQGHLPTMHLSDPLQAPDKAVRQSP